MEARAGIAGREIRAREGKEPFAMLVGRFAPPLSRRAFFPAMGLAAMGALAPFGAGAAAPLPAMRLGVLAFGTVQWVASVIRSNGLDRAHGFALAIAPLANNDSAKVALLGGAVDAIVSDWLFVGAERARGLSLSFAPFSSASGAVVLKEGSPVRGLKDLARRRLGVAGGPYDKSWMIVRAAAERRDGIDLAREADIVYASPPLLSAKLAQGALDAVLTYWNFVAALEVAGFRPLVTVSACAEALGLPARPPLGGYVFRTAWAGKNPHLIGGFLAASAAAEDLLVRSDQAWESVRPLMHAGDDRLFARLKAGFRAGIGPASPSEAAAAADRLFAILRTLGGDEATDGLDRLPAGVFWSAPS
ncbi:MAG TPA: ABC transporter substrate-binding protein [Acetobacteraceae bacterium]|nr:ABC transporter substrate-binding protein [Acetobacteraceae bacterium]